MERPDYTILDVPVILRFAFSPRPDGRPPPPGASDHTFTAEDGTVLAGRFFPYDKASPSILFFHGNGEVAPDYDDIAPLYNRIGINLFVAEFRGYGKSEGKPTISNMVADSEAVLEAFQSILKEQGYTGAVYVLGRSVGTYCAVELAASCPDQIGGFIAESGSANITGVMHYLGLSKSPEVVNLDRQHWARVKSIGIPLLVIHGSEDNLVPIERARELYESVGSTDKTFVTIQGAGHNDIMAVDSQRYFQIIRDFVHAKARQDG
ncbi:MAG: alpha/beta fold hydrolase [Dehalococcoidia bacterium]